MSLDLNTMWKTYPKPKRITKWTFLGFGLGALLVLAINLALLGAAIWVVVTVLRWTGVIQ